MGNGGKLALAAVAAVVVLGIVFGLNAVNSDGSSRSTTGRTAAVPPEARGQASDWDDQGTDGIRGIDVSLWDHGDYDDPVDFDVLKAQGVQFVFVKTSDSSDRADAQAEGWYSEDAPAAEAAGLAVGYYQYAVPTSTEADLEQDAIDLATRISERVGELQPGELPVVLDLESAPANLSASELTAFAVTWLETAEELTGRTPLLYTNTDFARNRLSAKKELTRFPLWQADYRKGESPPRIPGWPPAVFWQFSSAGQLDGKPGTLTDLNVFMGDEQEFLRMTGRS